MCSLETFFADIYISPASLDFAPYCWTLWKGLLLHLAGNAGLKDSDTLVFEREVKGMCNEWFSALK
jgi:hypothetical protein